MKNVGVIGLGIMGAPMARNLLKGGFAVTVYNRTASKADALVVAGASRATSIGDLAARCDAIVVMLSDDAAVKHAILGDGGILHAVRPGTCVIDSSTVHPRTSRECSAALKAKGVPHLDAPVTGSRKQAEEASLSFLIGGEENAYRECLGLFQAMGKKMFYLGATGCGACAKLGNNLMGAIHMAAFAEAMTLMQRYGIDPQKFFEIISQSGARSAMAEVKGPKMLRGDLSPDFALSLMHKDVRLAEELAAELKTSLPILSATRGAYRAAQEELPNDGDVCAIYEWYRNKK